MLGASTLSVDLLVYVVNGVLLVKVRTQGKIASISDANELARRQRQGAITRTVLMVDGVHLVLNSFPFMPSLYIMLSGGENRVEIVAL